MRVVIQRVLKASVTVKGYEKQSINHGLVVLVGFQNGDTLKELEKIVKKIVNLRIFEENDKMNLSVKDVNGAILSVSQFTLMGDAKKGNRPSFTNSMHYVEAERMYNKFNEVFINEGMKVKTGVFKEHMEVTLVNDGPVTIIINSRDDKNE